MYSTKHAGYIPHTVLVMYSVGCHDGGGGGGLRYGISMSTLFIYISQQCSGFLNFLLFDERIRTNN